MYVTLECTCVYVQENLGLELYKDVCAAHGLSADPYGSIDLNEFLIHSLVTVVPLVLRLPYTDIHFVSVDTRYKLVR